MSFSNKIKFYNNRQLKNVFIPTNQSWISTEKEKLNVQESGPQKVLFYNIIDLIKKAKKVICLQSFLIQDTEIIDELVRAFEQRNVKVYVLDSAEARLESFRFEEDENFKITDYKRMLNKKFNGRLFHRQANNLHSKFILIDPKSNPKGYLFTGNFNLKPFHENPELAVKLSPNQIIEFFKLFVYHFWEHTTDEQTNTTTFAKVKPANMFKAPVLDHVLVTSPNSELSNLKKTLIKSVQSAQQHIIISTFGFDINHELSQEILNKMQQKVKVTIFCRDREKAIRNNIEQLSKMGARVFCHQLIHAKSLIVDDEKAYIFTANFETQGLDSGFETGIKLNKAQTKDLLYIYSIWEKTFPYKYFAQKNIQEVHKFKSFDSDKIKTVTTEDEKQKNVTCETILQLSKYFSSIEAPKNSAAKCDILNTIVKTPKKPEDFNIINKLDEFLEIEFVKKDKNNSKVFGIILNKSNLDTTLIKELEENYKKHYLFSE